MDPQSIIAKRIAGELRAGMLVNLGIGIPTMVANFVPADGYGILSIGERPDRNRPDPRGGDGASYPYRRRGAPGDSVARR
jgi:acetate CoA/acetoacetate CoA-transferase beta subunit